MRIQEYKQIWFLLFIRSVPDQDLPLWHTVKLSYWWKCHHYGLSYFSWCLFFLVLIQNSVRLKVPLHLFTISNGSRWEKKSLWVSWVSFFYTFQIVYGNNRHGYCITALYVLGFVNIRFLILKTEICVI